MHCKKYMFVWVFIALLILGGNNSCIDLESQKVKNTIKNYMGRNIILPLTTRSKSNMIKIVTHINGNCGVCIEDLKKWENWIIKDSIKVDYFFYFNTLDSSIFLNAKSTFFNMPLIYDYDNAFQKQNGLLDKSKLFQTFLLNSDNKVVLIGNPVYNIELELLYRREIQRLTKERCQM